MRAEKSVHESVQESVHVQTGLIHHVRVVAENSLIKQTLYSLPWLLLGISYAYLFHQGNFLESFSWVTPVALAVAFFSARFSGMSWNRLLDANLDAKNLRTKNRLLPAGRARDVEVASHALLFLALFLLSSMYLPRMCKMLALPVGVILIGYSFTKRFTSLCHLTLGFIYFVLPLAAAFAFGGEFSYSLLLLALASGFVVSGCDVLYACQDAQFDRRFHLHSIPADHGVYFAVRFAAVCHLIAACSIALAMFLLGISFVSWMIFMVGMSLVLMKWIGIFSEGHGGEISQHFSALTKLYGAVALLPFITEVVWRGLS